MVSTALKVLLFDLIPPWKDFVVVVEVSVIHKLVEKFYFHLSKDPISILSHWIAYYILRRAYFKRDFHWVTLRL